MRIDGACGTIEPVCGNLKPPIGLSLSKPRAPFDRSNVQVDCSRLNSCLGRRQFGFNGDDMNWLGVTGPVPRILPPAGGAPAVARAHGGHLMPGM
ncbi:MAG: hypothetical protein HZB40_21205 [Rhodocyclales bacterium]|nr:hypothetical protein [Rhodocyclales bacterium]